jgi:hypothetical protein
MLKKNASILKNIIVDYLSAGIQGKAGRRTFLQQAISGASLKKDLKKMIASG